MLRVTLLHSGAICPKERVFQIFQYQISSSKSGTMAATIIVKIRQMIYSVGLPHGAIPSEKFIAVWHVAIKGKTLWQDYNKSNRILANVLFLNSTLLPFFSNLFWPSTIAGIMLLCHSPSAATLIMMPCIWASIISCNNSSWLRLHKYANGVSPSREQLSTIKIKCKESHTSVHSSDWLHRSHTT